MRYLSLFLGLILIAAGVSAGVREVELSLPLRSKIALAGHEKLYIGPFVREATEDTSSPNLRFDVATEFERYLRRLLRKEAKFVVIPPIDSIRTPTNDTLQLVKAADFWRDLGSRTGADFIVAGSIDFQIQDTTQQKTEKYTASDGRDYYRQVMVEKTGFTYDILLNVYDARTGALIFQEPMKDTKETEERGFDEFTGMFANLYSLENRLVGIFVPRNVKSKRTLFVP